MASSTPAIALPLANLLVSNNVYKSSNSASALASLPAHWYDLFKNLVVTSSGWPFKFLTASNKANFLWLYPGNLPTDLSNDLKDNLSHESGTLVPFCIAFCSCIA